uniref:PIH1D1/2/3 CS-like domain-containing protein n=1 Tax=Trichobilharzia regenti TaxID=157069 RepID=A0AA85K1L4_TRIRE|nr:unnamed protein product [Trichobilharzia regenti]
MSANKLLEDANKLWKMLDEMSENDLEGYQKFINRQFENFRKSVSPPVVRFVVRVTQKENKRPLLVIFCEWSVIPEPKSHDAPISVKCGDAFTVNEVDAITLAFNPKVFTEHNFNESLKDDATEGEYLFYSQKDHDDNRYQLVWLGLNYLENEKSLPTIESHSIIYSNTPIRPKLLKQSNMYGSKEQIYKSIGFLKRPVKTGDEQLDQQTSLIQDMTPETLTKLRRDELSSHYEDDDDMDSSTIKILKLPSTESNNSHSSNKLNNKVLIEEINEVSNDAGDPTQQRGRPVSWTAEVIPSGCTEKSGNTNKLKLTFKLPGLKSGKQCDVDLMKNRVMLKVVDAPIEFQPLDLRLPCSIDTGTAEAKFNSKKSKLIILVAILPPS